MSEDNIVSVDMNGPLTSTETSALDPYDGVDEAIESIGTDVIINSGYDISSLRQFREKLGVDVPLLGELGTVYEENGEASQLFEGDHSDIYDIHEAVYEKAVADGLKVHHQGNCSDVVGCTRIEATDSTADHPLYEQAQTIDVYESLDGDFEFDGDRIIFTPDREEIEELSDTMRYDHTYLGLRFEEVDDDTWAVHPDPIDRPDMNIEDAHTYLTDAIEDNGFHPVTNPDWGADYVKNGYGKDIGIRELTDAHVHHIGDKKSDVMDAIGNVSVYPLEGTEAHEYAIEHDVDHTAVKDIFEFVEIVNERVGQ